MQPIEATGALSHPASSLLPAPASDSGAVDTKSISKRRRSTAQAASACCRTCRLRKVKCGGPSNEGPCTNCRRLDYSCSFRQTGSSSSVQNVQDSNKLARSAPSRTHTEAGTPRKRAQKACGECHAHKTKCSGDLPKCKRCVAGGFACEYVAAKRKLSRVAAEPKNVDVGLVETPTESASTDPSSPVKTKAVTNRYVPLVEVQSRYLAAEPLLLNKDILVRHIDGWFQYIQTVPGMGFFHASTVYRALDEGEFPPIIAAGICAMTALVVFPGEAARSFSRQCKDRLDFYIFCCRGTISRESILPLALCCAYSWLTGQYSRAYRERADGADLAVLQNLNWDDSAGSPTEQESMRRVVWFIYVFERWMAGGYDYLLRMPDDMMKLRLPCNEKSFQDGRPIEMERLKEKPRAQAPSLHAFFIRLMQVRHQILRKTKAFVAGLKPHPNQPRLKGSEIMQDITDLRRKLVDLTAALPDHFKDSDINIRRLFNTPDWAPFVMFHSWVYTLYSDLHRFAMPGMREQAAPEIQSLFTPEFAQSCRLQAVGYAVSLAQFWQTLQQHVAHRPSGIQGLVVADWMAPSCLIPGVRVLLAARQYRLFHGLHEHSTAPLRPNRVVDDNELSNLLRSMIDTLDQILLIKPDLTVVCREIRQSIENYKIEKEEDLAAVGMIVKKEEVEHLKLPGPLHVLELAFVRRDDDEEEARRASSLADRLLQNRTTAPSQPPPPPPPPPLVSLDSQFFASSLPAFELTPPEAPITLSLARQDYVDMPDMVQIVQDGFYASDGGGLGMPLDAAMAAAVVPPDYLLSQPSLHPQAMMSPFGTFPQFQQQQPQQHQLLQFQNQDGVSPQSQFSPIPPPPHMAVSLQQFAEPLPARPDDLYQMHFQGNP